MDRKCHVAGLREDQGSYVFATRTCQKNYRFGSWGGEILLGSAQGRKLTVVYLGKHCPIWRTYLTTLNALLDQFAEIGFAAAAISADTAERKVQIIDISNVPFMVSPHERPY
jgi:peroxiredoxin